jgi:hypothetical protein
MNNELYGSNGMTRNVLKPLQTYAIIEKDLEKKRREDNGNYGTRRTSHLRGSSAHSKGFGVYYQSKAKVWGVGRDENRRAVENYKDCLKRLHQSAYPARKATRQKIKPASDWPVTIKDLATFRSSALLWKVKANDPWYIRATFSIASAQIEVKVTQEWVRDK